MKKNIGIIGYFGYSVEKPIIGGQMTKTIGIFNELAREYGKEKISRVDTSNWRHEKVKLIAGIIHITKTCDPIIILPNKNGIKIVMPLVCILKKLFKFSVAYPVVGGWLPDVLHRNKYLIKYLNTIDYVMPETKALLNELKSFYAGKMDIMPIFSPRKTLDEKQMVIKHKERMN